MKIRKDADLWFLVGLLLLAVVFTAVASTYPAVAGRLPTIIGVLMIALVGWQLSLNYLAGRQETSQLGHQKAEVGQVYSVKRWITIIVAIAYLALLLITGYLIATAVFLGLLVWLLGVKRWPVATVFALLGLAFLYVVFIAVLHVPLPSGLL